MLDPALGNPLTGRVKSWDCAIFRTDDWFYCVAFHSTAIVVADNFVVRPDLNRC